MKYEELMSKNFIRYQMTSALGSRYLLGEKLGGGSFGEIYIAENVNTSEEVAVKLESKNTKIQLLKNESTIYRLLQGGVGIPNIKYYGTDENQNALVMDLLGKSLQNLFIERNNIFSLKTVLMIADQMLTRIEYLHNKNLIHRDIKPENFVIGRGRKSNQIYMIDMGISKLYCDKYTHEHIKFCTGKSMAGTARYTSINSHLGHEQSRRDDMESIAYVLIYFLKGKLPWENIKAANKTEKNQIIRDLKINTPIEQLCEGLPNEFARFLTYARSLGFEDRPDYAKYRKKFRKLFIKQNYVYDFVYDWLLPCTTKSTLSPSILSESVECKKSIQALPHILKPKHGVSQYKARERIQPKITRAVHSNLCTNRKNIH